MFHLNDATKATVREVLVRNGDRSSIIYTDESKHYTRTGEEYAGHGTVKHTAGEYARYEGGIVVHTNNRRSALGVSDAERAADLLRGARDKRLTYRRIGEAGYA